MLQITTNLSGSSNAVLTDIDGEIIAIIKCRKKEVLNNKLIKAIGQHFVATDVEIDDADCRELTNQNNIHFSVNQLEDGLESIRDFKLKVIPTY